MPAPQMHSREDEPKTLKTSLSNTESLFLKYYLLILFAISICYFCSIKRLVKANENITFDMGMKLKIRAKLHIFPIILIFILGLWNVTAFAQNEKYHLKTVVIDPGHGGRDSGAPGTIRHEKDLVLNIGLKLGEYIKTHHPDVEIIYTRKTDTFIPLFKRAEIANKNKADLFISLHVNANENKRVAGTETYVMGLHKTQSNLEVAKKENAAILYEEDYTKKYEGFDPNSAESYIIFSLMQNAYLKQSLKFASAVQENFKQSTALNNRGVKQAGFLVLYKTSMPRVLIEAGFISNPGQEKYLNSETNQRKLAHAIGKAFDEYKEKLEQQSVVLDSSSKDGNREEAVQFRVQIAASSQPIPLESNYFKGLSNIREHKVGGQYKYTIGNFTDYEKAQKFKKKIRKDFPGAFIVAFQNEQTIPVQKALSESNQ